MKNFDLPSARAYLVSGLPHPVGGNHSGLNHYAGHRSDIDEFFALSTDVRGPLALTILDEHENPAAILYRTSQQFLSKPVEHYYFDHHPDRVTRTPNGALRFEWDREAEDVPTMPLTPHVDVARGSRPVTFDMSVMLAGIEPDKFAKKDALFVSAAIEIDLRFTIQDHVARPGFGGTSYFYRSWEFGEPVPIDREILRVYRDLATTAQSDRLLRESLDRTDLLCAATAILYKAPLFTAKPEAYEGLRHGLRVIEYGPTRSGSRKLPDRGERATLSAHATAAEMIHDHWRRGDPPTISTLTSFDFAISQPATSKEILELVLRIFRDPVPRDKDVWSRSVLLRAGKLAELLPEYPELRQDLLNEAYQKALDRYEGDDLFDLANAAIGLWGRWPDDCVDEIFLDIEDDPLERSSLRWYRVFLVMAGLTEDDVETEMRRVRASEMLPSRKRIEQLRREAGTGDQPT